MKSKNLIIGLLLLVGILTAYYFFTFSNKKTSEPLTENPVTAKVTMAVVISGGSRLQADLIKSLEIDKKYNIDIDLKPYGVAEIPALVASGAVDVGSIAPLQAAKLLEEGQKVKILLPIFKPDGCYILVHPGSGIEKVKELLGKRIGMSAKNTATYTFSDVVFSLNGYSLEKDFKITNTAFPGLIPLFEKKDVDAVIGLCDETVTSDLISSERAVGVDNLQDMWIKGIGENVATFIGMLTSKSDWAETNSEKVQALRLVYKDLFEYIHSHPEIYDDPKIRESLQIKSDAQAEVAKDLSKKFHPKPEDVDQQKLTKFLDIFFEKAVETKVLESIPQENLLAD